MTPETPQDGKTEYDFDRFICPFCHRQAFGSTDMCGGSFLDAAHPAVVRPVFIPAGEDEATITAQARERYRR